MPDGTAQQSAVAAWPGEGGAAERFPGPGLGGPRAVIFHPGMCRGGAWNSSHVAADATPLLPPPATF